jgi:hypothetical protein
MKVLHISLFDRKGGACIAAYRQHLALLDAGIDSRNWVRFKETVDTTVTAYEPLSAWTERLPRVLRRWRLTRKAKAAGIIGEIFEFRSEHIGNEFPVLADVDVVNVQFSQGFLDHPSFFKRVPTEIPVVITLHEMSFFTGGCSYAGACDRFQQACGQCPQLRHSEERDFSRRGWVARRDAYANRTPSNIHFVADSHWTAAQARKSSLLRNFPVSVIHYGVDTEIFRPVERTSARSTFGIPEGMPVVAFSAASVSDERKGMRHLVEALRKLPQKPFLLTWGRSYPTPLEEIPHLHLGHIESEHLMAHAYSAADLFVIPSLEEAFGQTALEALACGLPVVGFAAGGIPDMVRDGVTGLLAPVGNSGELGQAIERLIADPELRSKLGENARAMVLAEFTFERNAAQYVKLYRSLLGSEEFGHR